MYSLVDQMRRAAISVGMNLMEGAMRLGAKEYRQFVGIARGSAGEVCYQLLVARDLNYILAETYHELRSDYDRVIQMLSWLSQSLGSEPRTRSRYYPFAFILYRISCPKPAHPVRSADVSPAAEFGCGYISTSIAWIGFTGS